MFRQAKQCMVSMTTKGRFSPQGRYISTSTSYRSRLQIWDAQTYALIHTFDAELGGHFSPDERFFIVGDGEGTISLWNTQSWKKVLTFNSTGTLFSIVFLPNKPNILLFAGNENTTDIQNGIEHGKEVATFSLPETLGKLSHSV